MKTIGSEPAYPATSINKGGSSAFSGLALIKSQRPGPLRATDRIR
jgi:hypothetical protein